MLRALSLAALLLVLPTPGWSLNVVISNQNSAYGDAEVYFSFRDALVTGTINGQSLTRDQCYSLGEIGSGITLEQFAGGRIYFSLGVPLTGTGDPEPINSSVANWGTRFDKLELTYSQTDSSGVANLTAIDYFAIPLAIKTYGGSMAAGTPLATLTYQQPGDAIVSNLAALTGNAANVLLHDSAGNFLRVLGPTLAPAGVYPSFEPYLAAVQMAGQATHIVGLYSHLASTAAMTTQNYDFTATFDAAGNLDLVGGGSSYAGGASVGTGHEIVIQAGDLALGIYSANPDYTVDSVAAHIGDNDVYSAVVRDILTGFALGFVNSPIVDPLTGSAFEDESSDHWWSSAAAFGYLQSDPSDYDQYAAYLQSISNAYGYPFSDRWQTVQASLDPSTVGTMEIDVLPDAAAMAAAPVITSASSASAQAGVAFSYPITATNAPTSYSAAGLPAGLSLNGTSGLISGSATATGTFPVLLSATNAVGTGMATLALTVAATGTTTPAFFGDEVALANGVYYLAFPSGNYFGYYSFLPNPAYLYHFDLGFEYVFDAADGKSGVYLYDFASGTFFYTSPGFPFPYVYDFTLNSVLYYYPDPNNAGHYNTNGVRYFYDFNTGRIITK